MADKLAEQASEIRSFWWNPHKWLWGFGNYDINVITRALEQQRLTIGWFDQRKDVFTIPLVDLVGIILNVQTLKFWSRRHWFCLAQISGVYWNLDSRDDEPTKFPNQEANPLSRPGTDGPTLGVPAAFLGLFFKRVRPSLMASRSPAPTSPPSPNSALLEVDSDEIRCICGSSEDDGFTIQCESCLVWQHIVCVNIKSNAIPTHYLCERCRPRQPSVHTRTNSSNEVIDGPLVKTGGRTRKGHPDEADESLQERRKRTKFKNRPPSPGSVNKAGSSTAWPLSEYETLLSYQATSVNRIGNVDHQNTGQVKKYFRQIAVQRARKPEQRKHTPTTMADGSIGAVSPPLPPLTASPSSEGVPDSVLTHLTTMDSETLNHSLFKVSVRTLPPGAAGHTKKVGLFAESDIASMRFILEYKGYVGLRNVYERSPVNEYSLLKTSKPFVEFHQYVNLSVDARDLGNKARFLRRSCHPNSELRSVVLPAAEGDDVVHLALFATRDIVRGEEITVNWHWQKSETTPLRDGNSSLADPLSSLLPLFTKSQVAALVYTFGDIPCACRDLKGCRLNSLTQRYLNSASRPDKLLSLTPDPGKRRTGRPPKSTTSTPIDSTNGKRAQSPLPRVRGRLVSSPPTFSDADDIPDLIDSVINGYPKREDSSAGEPLSSPRTPGSGNPPLSREERKLRDTLALFEKIEQQKQREKTRGQVSDKRRPLSPYSSGTDGGIQQSSTDPTKESSLMARQGGASVRLRSSRGFGRRAASSGHSIHKAVTFSPDGTTSGTIDGSVMSYLPRGSGDERERLESGSEFGWSPRSSGGATGFLPSDVDTLSIVSDRRSRGERNSSSDRKKASPSRPRRPGSASSTNSKSLKRPRSTREEDSGDNIRVDVDSGDDSVAKMAKTEVGVNPDSGTPRVAVELRAGLKKYFMQCFFSAKRNSVESPVGVKVEPSVLSTSPPLNGSQSVPMGMNLGGVRIESPGSSDTESTIDIDTTTLGEPSIVVPTTAEADSGLMSSPMDIAGHSPTTEEILPAQPMVPPPPTVMSPPSSVLPSEIPLAQEITEPSQVSENTKVEANPAPTEVKENHETLANVHAVTEGIARNEEKPISKPKTKLSLSEYHRRKADADPSHANAPDFKPNASVSTPVNNDLDTPSNLPMESGTDERPKTPRSPFITQDAPNSSSTESPDGKALSKDGVQTEKVTQETSETKSAEKTTVVAPPKTRMSLKEYANLKRRVKPTTDEPLASSARSESTSRVSDRSGNVSPAATVTPAEFNGKADPVSHPVVRIPTQSSDKPVSPSLKASAKVSPDGGARDELRNIVTRELSGIVALDVLCRVTTPTTAGPSPGQAKLPPTLSSPVPVVSGTESVPPQAVQPTSTWEPGEEQSGVSAGRDLPEFPPVMVTPTFLDTSSIVNQASPPALEPQSLPPTTMDSPPRPPNLETSDLSMRPSKPGNISPEEGEFGSTSIESPAVPPRAPQGEVGPGYNKPPLPTTGETPQPTGVTLARLSGVSPTMPPVSRRTSSHDPITSSNLYRPRYGGANANTTDYNSGRHHGDPPRYISRSNSTRGSFYSESVNETGSRTMSTPNGSVSQYPRASSHHSRSTHGYSSYIPSSSSHRSGGGGSSVGVNEGRNDALPSAMSNGPGSTSLRSQGSSRYHSRGYARGPSPSPSRSSKRTSSKYENERYSSHRLTSPPPRRPSSGSHGGYLPPPRSSDHANGNQHYGRSTTSSHPYSGHHRSYSKHRTPPPPPPPPY
ncbi:SET domain-containing protein 3 [Dispira simplex]|nr:SET domain-containing protein 3 [Dispira simplex]